MTAIDNLTPQSIPSRLIVLAACAVLAFVFILNAVFTISNALYLYLLAAALLFTAIAVFSSFSKLPERVFITGLIALSLLLRISFSLIVNPEPFVDFARMWDAANAVAAGDFSFQDKSYFVFWSYQSGFIAYQALIVRIFGAGSAKTALIVLNCVYMTGTNVLIYLFAKKFGGFDNNNDKVCARAGRLASLVYLVYPAPYFLAPVLLNDHIATFVILLGLYFVLKNTRVITAVTGGVLLALGNALRPVGIIAVVSVVVYFGVILWRLHTRKRNLGDGGPYIKCACAVIIVYFSVSALLSLSVSASGLNKNGLKNTEPLWKFVAGLNYESNGAFSSGLYEAALGQLAPDDPPVTTHAERESAQKVLLRTGLPESAKEWLEFLYKKHKLMWATYEDLGWAFGPEAVRGKAPEYIQKAAVLTPVLRKFDRAVYMSIWLFALTGAVYQLKTREIRAEAILIYSVILLYFAAHIFIEVQPRYRYFEMTFVCIATGSAGRVWSKI